MFKMIETIEQDQTIRDVQTINSETVMHAEPELLVPIAEYASREFLSRRTVDRYVQIGRLEKIKQHGQTYIVDKPLKPQLQETRHDRNVPDSQIVPLAQTDWIRLGYLQARSRSKTFWQTYAIVLTILFVSLMLASLWLFAQWQFVTTSSF